jgi:large-conductance mechanosensitive channel
MLPEDETNIEVPSGSDVPSIETPHRKGRIRTVLGGLRKTAQKVAKGSKEFVTSELQKVGRFSKYIAIEAAALFIMAIVAGIALAQLLKSFVFDLLMPVIGLISPRGDWQNLQFRIGQTQFRAGNFLAHLLFFVVVVLVAVLIIKLSPKKPKMALQDLIRHCPTCGGLLLPGATECETCGTRLLDFPEDEQHQE